MKGLLWILLGLIVGGVGSAYAAPHAWWALGWPFGFRGGPANHRLWMSSWWLSAYDDIVIAERLQLVEDIWDSSAADTDADALPLTDAARILLDERLDERDANPDAGLPWSDVRARILRKHRR